MADKYWWEQEEEKNSKSQTQSQSQTDSNQGYWWEGNSLAKTASEQISSRVDTWLKNHKNYVSNYQSRYSGRKFTYEDDYVNDPNDWLNTVSKQKSNFDAEADSILSYMDQFGSYLDADWAKSVKETLASARDQQQIVLENATADSKWWRNFANEDEYKTAQRYDSYNQKYGGQKYEDIQKALGSLEDGSEEKWWLEQTQYDLYQKDGAYSSKALSGLKSYEAQKVAEQEKEANKTWWERAAESYTYAPADTSLPAAALSNAAASYRNDTSYREINDKWSEGQKNQFGYLYAENPQKAYDYAEQVNNEINAYEKYLQQQSVGDWSSQNLGTGTVSTLGAIASAPLGAVDFLDDIVEYTARGTITQKSHLSPFEMGQAAISGNANALNEKFGTLDEDLFAIGGKGLGDVYSLGVSAANSLVSAYTLGGTGTLVNFIGQGGASGVDDALSRGATAEQALLYGTIVGAAEGVTEMINADKLLKIGSASTLKNYLLKALNQGIGESVEEGASSIISNIADRIIMQDKSNFNANVKEIMKNNPGMSEEEAKKQAWIDMAGDIAFDAMGGFATGFGNASATTAVKTIVNSRKGNQENIDALNQYGDKTDALILEGLKNDKKTESHQLAEKYKEQVAGKDGKEGKALTGFQIRNLLAANHAEVTAKDMKNIQQAAEKRLSTLGQREDVSKIAELATKYATGGQLSRAEKSFLTRSQYGSQVTSELLDNLSTEYKKSIGADKLLSGWENDMSEGWGDNYSSEWTEDIGTRNVNTAAYNKKMIRSLLDAAANMPVEDAATYKPLEERISDEGRFGVSENGQATIRATGKAFDFENAEVAEVGEGLLSFKREDGGKVSAGGIDFADADQSFLVSAVSDIENITPVAATEVMHKIVDMSKPLGAQLNGIDESYTYGYNNYSVEDMKAGQFTGNLTEEQAMRAYELGQEARKISTTGKAEAIKRMRTAAQAAAEKSVAEGKKLSITYNHGGGVVEDISTAMKKLGKLNPEQRAGIEAADILHKMGIGTDFELFSSYYSKTLKDKDGNALEVFLNDEGQEEAAYAGVYFAADGKIRINLNAYSGTKGLTLNALSHELTHFIQQWSPEKYKTLADFLVKAYGEKGVSMHQLVLKEQARLNEIRGKGKEVSYNEAYDEVVANAFNRMLEDGKVMDRIAELRKVDKSLADKIVERIRKFIKQFFKFYKNNDSLFWETEALMEMRETFEELQNMFAEALVDASDSFQASRIALETEAVESLGENAKVETNAAGELLLASNESGSVQIYSAQTYLNGGRDKLEMALRQNGHTAAEIKETLSYVDDALDYIKILAAGYAKNMGYTNLSDHLIADIVTNVKTGKQVMSAIVNNGDYPVNIDLSLICKKRVAYMNLMSRLIRDGVFDKVNYDGAAIAEVNQILRENGFETACLGCFVESRRLQFQTWAETIVSEWNAEVEKRNPNADGFGFAKGKMEQLTDADINALTRELESVKKNDQGNVNLGQGNSVTRMGRLLDALPSLQKKLTVEDLLTPEGLTALRKHDGSLFSIVKSRYGAASPKIVQDFNPYASEIAMLTFAQVKGITNNAVKGAQAYVTEVKNENGKLKKAKGESKADFNQRKKVHDQRIQDEAMRRYLYDIGGARIQSFSDFMIENVFDYIQIFADLAAKRLPLHGYTKEIVCMRLFGMTGAKWNGSLIAHVERSMGKEFAGLLPAGTKDGIPVRVNGKDYVIGFDDYARNAATGGKSFIQSIGMKDIIALQLDPRYSPYVGNITIGVSDAQILAMLDNPLFRMVIPYHASGMLPMFAKLVGVDMYNDYTDYQNTTVRQYYDLNGNAVSELKNAKGEAVKADTSYAFNAEIQKTKDAKTAANNYLNWCAQRHEVYDGSKLVGYATFNPKFSSSPYGTDFTRHANYYKLLEDFNTYNCVTEESAVQGEVAMRFPSEENRLTEQQMAEYKKALRDTGIFTEKDIEKYAKKADMTFKEIIAAEVGNRANYAATQAPKWESTVKAVEAKLQKDYAREQQSSQKTDREYLDAVQRGDMETVIRMVVEAAKKAGFSIEHLYHGTSFFGFTTIDTSESDDSISFFATNNPEVAQGYMPWYEDDASDRYHDEPRRIGKHIKKRAITNSSSIENVVKTLNETFDNQYKNARAATDKETLDSFKLYQIPEMVDAAAELIKRNVPQKISDLCRLVVEANEKDTFAAWADVAKRYKEFESAEIPYDPDDWSKDILWSHVVVHLQSIAKMARTEPIWNDGSVIMKSALIDRYNTYLGGESIGMYDFYGKNENQMVIWGNGSNWKSIPLGEHDAEFRKWLKETRGNIVPDGREVRASTRDISEFAKHLGYRSVVFVDIYDAGAYGERGVLSDVYSYFYPQEDIKSADPVTYDDNGNVIPLSERFNPKNQDIRYSSQKTDRVKTFANGQNAMGEFVANVLIDLANSDSDWWTGGYNYAILSMNKHDDTEFRRFYQKIEKLTRDMDEYEVSKSRPIKRSFTIRDGKGKEFIYRVSLDGYMHGVVIEKIDKAKYVTALRKATKGGAYGKSLANIKRRARNNRAGLGGNSAGNGGNLASNGNPGYGGVGGGSPQSNSGGVGRGGNSSNRKVPAVTTAQKQVKSTQQTDNITSRHLLANAFEGISQNSEEYKMIQDYKGRVKILNELETKLSQLNAEIHKMRFSTDGTRDSAKLRELEAKAKNIAKEINGYDKKLLQMEASEPLRKVIDREKAKASQKTREHVKEIQQNKKARMEQTELRHKIRKAVRDLDKILNRGNKKQNVKEDMQPVVAQALKLADYLFTDHISNDELIRKGIDADLVTASGKAQLVRETEEILSRLDAATDINNPDNSLTDEEFARLDAKRKTNEEKLRDLLTAQRNRRLSTPVYQLFDDLVKSYASLKNSKQDAVKAAYNEELEKSLRAFIDEDARVKILKNMRVADMTTEELNWLLRAYTMVLHNVRNANKFFAKNKAETIDQVAGRIAKDFGSVKIPEGKLAIAARNLANKIGWDYEKLYYALDRIGSEAFTELIMNIADAENTVMQDIMEAAAFRDKAVKDYGFNDWDINKEIDREFLDNTGKKFKLTLGQMMALYAYSRREGAWDHIEYGGFVFGEAALTNPRPADSYKLSKEQCEAITNLLTAKQKGYVEAMQKFLSETMGAKGNEVSMMLYGIEMFKEKNYFPIHIAGQFKAQANESQAKAAAGFQSMSNAGFTHAQNPNAKAPFVLEAFNEVWVDHVNEMSRYHGTVPALEDLRRVMNRSTYSDSGNESTSIKQMMINAHGEEATKYFDNLYREANSGAITDKLQATSKKLLSLFRKNSVAYSLSVLVQQPASLVRAYAMIDPKYFGFKGVGALASGVTKAVTSKWNKAYDNAYNEMLKYAPGVTMAKEIGGFDTATGGSIRSYLLDTDKSLKQKWKTGTAVEKGKAFLDLVDDNAIANLPNVADKIAWIEIWNAVKRETVATHKNLKPNSEGFMQAVGERFTEVIRATQVYDSIFAKSPLLKSKNLAVQYLVSFMNEPNTVANMAESALRDATRGDWKNTARKASVLINSIVFTGVLKSLVYAMRDDDEDETYIEKYLESLTGSLMDDFNALNYIPIARDVWSLAQGYDVERADMAIVADAVDALNSVIKNMTKDTEGMTEEQLIEFDKKCTEAEWKLAESLAAFVGIPVKNIRREFNGVRDHARITAANRGLTTKHSAWKKIQDAVVDSIPFMSADTKQEKLYDAIMSGDKTYIDRVKNTYVDKKGNFDQDKYDSAVRKVLRENDPRVKAAAQAKYDGNANEYKRIFREIQKEGHFSFDDIMNAINTEESAIRKKLAPETISSEYSAADFVDAMIIGDTGMAKTMMDDIISVKVAKGDTQEEAEESFQNSVTTQVQNNFKSDLLDESGAAEILTAYAGMDDEEADGKINYWAFCKDHPEYDLTQERVEMYWEFAEPMDIELDVYNQFVMGTKDMHTIRDEWGDEVKSKKEQVLEFIDSLDLTWKQKDALYFAAGYAESGLVDVPW